MFRDYLNRAIATRSGVTIFPEDYIHINSLCSAPLTSYSLEILKSTTFYSHTLTTQSTESISKLACMENWNNYNTTFTFQYKCFMLQYSLGKFTYIYTYFILRVSIYMLVYI